MEIRTFEAPAGERLDVAIAVSLALSRTFAKDLVNDGYVTLDGRPVGKPSTRLQGEEIVSVAIPPPRPMVVEPEDIGLDVIYEDEMMAVINKPPGLVAHPTATVRTGTVVNALMGRMRLSKEKVFEPTSGEYRPGIVHRLDKETSGVMVVAKTNEAHRHLARSFKQRLTVKEYVAIGIGAMEPRVDLDAPIGRHPVRRQSMTVGGTNPKSARTRFRVLAQTSDHVFVKARPHSGRTHQIRVHMLHLGAPILGDGVYGRASSAIDRQALHAFRLTIPHPHDNQAVTFSARVPEDMVSAWLALGGAWPPSDEPDLS